MAVKGFTFWLTYYDVAQDLTPAQQGQFYRAICDYMFTDDDPEDRLKGAVRTCFKAVKPHLVTSRKRSESGRQALGSPKANRKQTESKSKANQKQYQYQYQDKDKGQTESKADFTIPDDAKAQLIELGLMHG